MQLLADTGYEVRETPGLGFVPGVVQKMNPQLPAERIPHVGWNSVQQQKSSELLLDIPDHTDFYFVHSFHFVSGNPAHVIGTTPYCGGIVSMVENGPVFGAQFHPEKSSKGGLRLLQNFLALQVTAPC